MITFCRWPPVPRRTCSASSAWTAAIRRLAGPSPPSEESACPWSPPPCPGMACRASHHCRTSRWCRPTGGRLCWPPATRGRTRRSGSACTTRRGPTTQPARGCRRRTTITCPAWWPTSRMKSAERPRRIPPPDSPTTHMAGRRAGTRPTGSGRSARRSIPMMI